MALLAVIISAMKRPIEGVNLGGWLVLERWMTPSLFKGTEARDEISFMKTPGATKKLKTHRDSFITEDDWRWLSENGVKLVRLPVGYWVLSGADGFAGAKGYLDWAFTMAEKYGVGILLDVHALKGSQNGEMHSGVIGAVDWWRYRHENIQFIAEIAERYSSSPALWGVEVINEPKLSGGYFKLLWFYRRAYSSLRKVLRPGIYTIFHDAFVAPIFAGSLWARRGYPVVMDSHFYLLPGRFLYGFSPEKYDYVRRLIYGPLIAFSKLFQPVVVGEWSSVLPQPMFNRVDRSVHLDMLDDTIKRQRKIYAGSLAMFYWNYKTEGRGMYNFKSLVEDGIITLEK